jgi:hypothetical protein
MIDSLMDFMNTAVVQYATCRNPICDLCAARLPDHSVDTLALGGRTLEAGQTRAHDSVPAVRSRLEIHHCWKRLRLLLRRGRLTMAR